MVRIKTQQAVGTALAISSLLALAACSDPGATAATAPSSASAATAGGKTFNLTPEQNRVKVTVDAAAAALVPEAIKADGKLTVVTTGGTAPLSLFATDNKTLIGSEVDIAYAVGETLGLEVEVLPVAWADWPLGVESGKYEAVLSNVTVTEARKEKFDFATYRNDLLGFYAKTDSPSARSRKPRTSPASASSSARAPTRKPSWCAGMRRTRPRASRRLSSSITTTTPPPRWPSSPAVRT